MIYQMASSTDLANFAEKTLWGTQKHGSKYQYRRGGEGTVYITDGSTLEGIGDKSYDFVMGSQYREHLINPLKALVTMKRVLKPGGCIILILPKKEVTFERHGGITPSEDLLVRYLHGATESDTEYANIKSWLLGHDAALDGPASVYSQMMARSIRFVDENRAIHSTVWDLELLQNVALLLHMKVVAKGVEDGLHQWIMLRKPL
jgi:SAM-dependent methyltransferase